MITLELPFPPSVNHYWRLGKGHFYVSEAGRRYCQYVARAALASRINDDWMPPRFPRPSRVRLSIFAHPPDNRIRDLDNLLKVTLDALKHAGLYDDDSQCKVITARMQDRVEGGRLLVRVHEMRPARAKADALPASSRTRGIRSNRRS